MKHDRDTSGTSSFSGDRKGFVFNHQLQGLRTHKSLLELELAVSFQMTVGAWLNNYTSQPLCKTSLINIFQACHIYTITK